MSQGTVNGSPAHEVAKSAAHELNQVPVTLDNTIQWQQLWVSRFWVGYAAFYLTGFWGETPVDPTVTPNWNPTSTWRANYRKRYKSMTVDATGLDSVDSPLETFPPSYSSSNSLSGGGFTPDSDMHATFTETPPFSNNFLPSGSMPAASVLYPMKVLTSSANLPVDDQLDCGPVHPSFPSIDSYVSGNWTSGTLSGFPDAYIYSWMGGGGFTVGLYLHNHGYSFTLSSEHIFADHLDTVATEINGESFPTWAPNSTTASVFNDFYENYDGSGSTSPAHWDGSVISIPGTFSGVQGPYFGADTANIDALYLWSGWFYESREESTADVQQYSVDAGALFSNQKIQGMRTRFDTPSVRPYFIAEATVVRLTDFSTLPFATPAHSASDIADVHVIITGTTTPGTPIEIPWPTESGFDDFKILGANSLSMGKIVFAIVGESAAAWSARTGIIYT